MTMDKARETAIAILAVIEDFLAEHGVAIPNPERDEYQADDQTEKAILFGSQYYALEDSPFNMVICLLGA